VTSAGIEGGKNLAESAQDLERTRKAINVQLAEFDGVKKSLLRDLQNRCEKVGKNPFILNICSSILLLQVVVLEIQLDEIKEQYNNVIRNSNSKAQQKKMAFLERNLEQLTLVQKQVTSPRGREVPYIRSADMFYWTACGSELDFEEGGWDR
jgi:kinesin family protein 5